MKEALRPQGVDRAPWNQFRVHPGSPEWVYSPNPADAPLDIVLFLPAGGGPEAREVYDALVSAGVPFVSEGSERFPEPFLLLRFSDAQEAVYIGKEIKTGFLASL